MAQSFDTPVSVEQFPPPGDAMVMYCGDTITFTLSLGQPVRGRAWVRTNLGTAEIARKEIIHRIEKNEIKLDEAWSDFSMTESDKGMYQIRLPLTQTGFFQAKCFFIPEKTDIPVWPPGDNTIINVEPAGTCCANIIYNAFVRQFGRSKAGRAKDLGLVSYIESLDNQGYTVIPESGKFRDLKKEIGFIFSQMGCRALHLLPIHPTPTTYARMGRFGSPYAALNFTEVDPALAVFDPSATPLEQFLELVDTVHFYSGYVIMDIAINHTGWAASIHESHPEWLDREEDGEIKAPGAWGVVWADLTKLDYSHTDLWQYMAQIFLLWCHRGVDGFRCDAGYMIPVQAWEYIIAKIRQEYPDTLFFLEGLGGPLKTTRKLLCQANFNWAYSELFQQYTREEIRQYLPFAAQMSESCGHLIHFAETHDNNRLASVSHTYAKMRTALCALFSICGGFGFANGVEWYAQEKINVHESSSLNWGNPKNQVRHLTRLNLILREHPLFAAGTQLSLIEQSESTALVLLRYHPKQDCRMLVLVNLDCAHAATAVWQPEKAGIATTAWFDLLTGVEVRVKNDKEVHSLHLEPGEVMALTSRQADLDMLSEKIGFAREMPERVLLQKRKSQVLTILTAINGYTEIRDLDVEAQALDFARNPAAFIRAQNPLSKESRVILFDARKDLNRQVMIPPGFFLMVQCQEHFRAELLDESGRSKKSLGYQEALPTDDKNNYFVIFMPQEIRDQHRDCTLVLRIFGPETSKVKRASLKYLAPFDRLSLRMSFTRKEIAENRSLKQLSTTDKGGMMRAAASFGRLESRYDALLGANLNPKIPENRWMLLSRYRIWGIFQGYSRQLSLDCLQAFWASYDKGGKWRFHVPTSEGKYYVLVLFLQMDRKKNRVTLILHRESKPEGSNKYLADDRLVNVIIRPDIEDRSFHDTVKAFKGPEAEWPKRIEPFEKGFFFQSSRQVFLRIKSSKDGFVREPEWQYMVHRKLETTRGLDPDSDLFSPGFFKLTFKGGETINLDAQVLDEKLLPDKESPRPSLLPGPFESTIPFDQALEQAIDAFIVDRNGEKSVIAGFPWFLDWGRDSLIFCRSLIEIGRTKDALAVLKLFGKFENQGTLPNMICGADARNIETSDAPLWFFVCCRELVKASGDSADLDEDIGGRTIRRILFSMAQSMIKGTPTGVRVDPDSFLLYSPAHFTWMDTNFPAGSPRQGYPVEIQALWFHALDFLSVIDTPSGQAVWKAHADRVKESIIDLFWRDNAGFFSDCLHCDKFCDAGVAQADDALRPNQLLLITLGVLTEKEMMQKAVETCQELIVPGAIRSLADRRLEKALVISLSGQAVSDPHHPYAGAYKGDEDTERKPAYHNGTAWTWLFPVYCEAWAQAFGKSGIPTSLAWLGSTLSLMRTGAAGFVPEILDGDFPHQPRGCDAQGWGSSEIARVAHKLNRLLKER